MKKGKKFFSISDSSSFIFLHKLKRTFMFFIFCPYIVLFKENDKTYPIDIGIFFKENNING